MPLPPARRALYACCNGSSNTVHYYSILSSTELLEAWQSWLTIYNDWLLEDLKSMDSDGGKTLPMYVTPHWIPFMTEGNGNYLALDYAPGKKGQAGQIIGFGADEYHIKVFGEDLLSFLQSLVSVPNALSEHLG